MSKSTSLVICITTLIFGVFLIAIGIMLFLDTRPEYILQLEKPFIAIIVGIMGLCMFITGLVLSLIHSDDDTPVSKDY